MLVPPKSSSAVLVMIRSKYVSICSHSRARLVDSSRNRTFWRGYANLMRSYGGLLEPRGSKLAPLKSMFTAKISFAVCVCQSPVILTQFTLEMCVAARNREKITKNPYVGVQGRSRSSMLVPPESSSAVLVMMRSKSVSICNRSLARLDDSTRNCTFQWVSEQFLNGTSAHYRLYSAIQIRIFRTEVFRN